MPKAPKPGFYAVARGRVPGIYATWDECQAQTAGFAGNKHKKFPTVDQAKAYLAEHGVTHDATLVPAASSSASASSTWRRSHTRKQSSGTSGVPDHSYNTTSSKRTTLATGVIQDESGWDVVYSDGACKGNGKTGSIAGIGVWWGQNDARNLAERCPGGQTNNRAELIAIVRVLETTPHTKRPLLIKTDSKYCISCFRDWMPKWLENGFKTSSGGPVKNAPLIRYLSALLDMRARQGQKIHLQYVKGHAGIEGNEGADRLANFGATMSEEPERDWDTLIDGLGNVTEDLLTKPTSLVTVGLSQEELEAYAVG